MYEDSHLEMAYEDRFEADEDFGDTYERYEEYCDYCETEGHTFRKCPQRDDEVGV